jgi:hypothetical protein
MRAKRRITMSTVPTDARRLFESVGVVQTVSTAEAAVLLGLAKQTLLRWSSTGDGPIRPIRLNGRLRWSVADIRALVGGAK